MNRLVCNAEEPLAPNGQLDALDEQANQLALATFGSNELFRYSFVSPDSAGLNDQCDLVLDQLAGTLGLDRSWVAVCRGSDDVNTGVRTRVFRSKIVKAGWKVDVGHDLLVAQRNFNKKHGALVPDEIDQRIAGWFIALGSWASVENLLNPPFLASMKMMSITHRLQPSREFLLGVGAARGGVAYVARADMDRESIVLVTHLPLTSSIQQLVSDGKLLLRTGS